MAHALTLGEIFDRDKRNAARYEAGHVTYAEAYGVPVTEVIRRNPRISTAADARRERCWLGHTEYDPVTFWALPVLKLAAYGLAGSVAADDEWVSADTFLDLWEYQWFSDTDRQYVRRDWQNRRSSCRFVLAAVEEAADVLRRNQTRLDRIVGVLIANEKT